MREYEHLMVGGEILLPDPKSVKAAYGLQFPEYLDSDSPHFLREGHTLFPDHRVIYQLTEPSEAIIKEGNYSGAGGGYYIVEERQPSGWYAEHGIHKSKVRWER